MFAIKAGLWYNIYVPRFKAKSPEGLTEWEEMERSALRREYIDSVLGSLKGQLDNTYIVDEKGNKTKLQKKGEK